MNIGINQPVFVYLPSGENTARPYHAGVVTAVWQDDSGNTDPTVAPVLCSVCVLPFTGGDVARCIGAVNVYASQDAAGNAAADARGYAFVSPVDEQSKPPAVGIRAVASGAHR